MTKKLIDEVELTQAIHDLRLQNGWVAFAVMIDGGYGWLAGLPVIDIWDTPMAGFPLPSPEFLIMSTPVQEPGMACAELGAE